jgi:hypothetical protein
MFSNQLTCLQVFFVGNNNTKRSALHSTVTDFARFQGLESTQLGHLPASRLLPTDRGKWRVQDAYMTPPNARDLSALRERGAKVIVYHGVSDPNFSVEDSVAWYRGIDRHSRGRAKDFARLYAIPGMNHCSGGRCAPGRRWRATPAPVSLMKQRTSSVSGRA